MIYVIHTTDDREYITNDVEILPEGILVKMPSYYYTDLNTYKDPIMLEKEEVILNERVLFYFSLNKSYPDIVSNVMYKSNNQILPRPSIVQHFKVAKFYYLNMLFYMALKKCNCYRFGIKLCQIKKRVPYMNKFNETAYVRTIFNRKKYDTKTWNITGIVPTNDNNTRYMLNPKVNNLVLNNIEERKEMKYFVKQNNKNV